MQSNLVFKQEKEKDGGPPSMPIRFYYISSVHNKVIRFSWHWGKAVNTLLLVLFDCSTSV